MIQKGWKFLYSVKVLEKYIVSFIKYDMIKRKGHMERNQV